MEYREYLDSDHWRRTRELRLHKDQYTCQMCGSREIGLQVHHISYKRRGNEDIDTDLITLCKSCHSEVHDLLQCRAVINSFADYMWRPRRLRGTTLKERLAVSIAWHVSIRKNAYDPQGMKAASILIRSLLSYLQDRGLHECHDFLRRNSAQVLSEAIRMLKEEPAYVSAAHDCFDGYYAAIVREDFNEPDR